MRLQRLRLVERAGGRGRGGLVSRRRSARSRTTPLPSAKRQRGYWCKCVPHGGKPESVISSTPPCPKSLPPPSLLLANGTCLGGGGTAAARPCMQEAFASICTVPTNQFMVSAFILNFPGATPLDCKELDNLPRPPTGTVRVVRRPLGPLPPNSASPVPQSSQGTSCHASAV